LNQATKGLSLFRTALKANPHREQFWLSYIGVLIQENEFELAAEALKKATIVGVAEKKLNILLSHLDVTNLLHLYGKGQYGEAEKLASLLIEKSPTLQVAWKVLAAVLKLTGRINESLAASEKAVHLDPQDSDAFRNLGNTLRVLGRFDEAEASYRQAIAINPQLDDAHSALGIMLRDLGKLDEAAVNLRLAITLKPYFAKYYDDFGILLQRLEQYDDAEKLYVQYLAIEKVERASMKSMGAISYERGDFQKALVLLIVTKQNMQGPMLSNVYTLWEKFQKFIRDLRIQRN